MAASRFIKRVKLGDKGVHMSGINFKRMAYLFVLCITLFPNSYYNVNSRHLNYVDDIENLENYL